MVLPALGGIHTNTKTSISYSQLQISGSAIMSWPVTNAVYVWNSASGISVEWWSPGMTDGYFLGTLNKSLLRGSTNLKIL